MREYFFSSWIKSERAWRISISHGMRNIIYFIAPTFLFVVSFVSIAFFFYNSFLSDREYMFRSDATDVRISRLFSTYSSVQIQTC